MEPGARPSGSGREEGGTRGTPAPRRTRTWSPDGPGLGTPNDRPRPAASPPRAPLRRGRPALCAPGRRGDRALGGRARGPGGAEEKDERRADPCPPRGLLSGPAVRERRFWSRIPVVVSVKASHLLPTAPSHR
ncbi:collagen alpha-1(X) chain-like [Bubalus bubalis]|uniref:collagen alpha-1(X) chain-like n=1 Tax=Bubalus bubalis TaxID=89462 RepID=UPI001D112E29|nr:collagen alpha-1(X) chain-like [Bubalus bubalis]